MCPALSTAGLDLAACTWVTVKNSSSVREENKQEEQMTNHLFKLKAKLASTTAGIVAETNF